MAATVLLQLSYWPILLGRELAGSSDPDTVAASGGAIAFGLALAPLTLGVLALVSRTPRPTRRTFTGLGVFLLVALPLGLLAAPAALATGFAAAGAVVLRRDEGLHPPGPRWVAVAIGFVYLFLLQYLSAPFAVMSGAVLPFTIIGMADMRSEAAAMVERSDA